MVKGLHITQAIFCPKIIIKALSVCTHLHVCEKNISTTIAQSWSQCRITNGCNAKHICSESPQILVTMHRTVTAPQLFGRIFSFPVCVTGQQPVKQI